MNCLNELEGCERSYAIENFNWSQNPPFYTTNIDRKGKNADCQHFLLFPQCFQKASFSWLFKVGIVW